jgi:hypothetical protein
VYLNLEIITKKAKTQETDDGNCEIEHIEGEPGDDCHPSVNNDKILFNTVYHVSKSEMPTSSVNGTDS